jgi:hypothetical protein
MSKKSRLSKNGRTAKAESTFAVRLTERDLIILQQAVESRMEGMNCEVMDDGFSDEDRQWRLEELLRDHELDKKLRQVMPKMTGSLRVEILPETLRKQSRTA